MALKSLQTSHQDFFIIAGRYRVDSGFYLFRSQLNTRPGCREKNYNCQLPLSKVLLKAETLIGSNKDLETFLFGGIKQSSVGQVRSPSFVDRFNKLIPEMLPERHGGSLVKENLHRRSELANDVISKSITAST